VILVPILQLQTIFELLAIYKVRVSKRLRSNAYRLQRRAKVASLQFILYRLSQFLVTSI